MSLQVELLESVHILGKAEFLVIEGEIGVNGRRISKDTSQGRHRIYSPRSTALLEIEPVSGGAKVEFFELCDGLEGIQGCQSNFENIFEPEMEAKESFHQVINGLYFLKRNSIESPFPLMRISEEWMDALREPVLNVQGAPVIFVCGHRKVGKSSFCRFLLNGLLNEVEEVDFIDLDLGQTEFTPSGFLTRRRFNKSESLLGPPFTHLLVPDDSIYLATSNVSDIPFLYCKGMETLKKRRDESAIGAIPVVINTMGWMTGLGLELLIYALQVFRPNHVVSFMAPEGDEDFMRKCLMTNSFGSKGALKSEEAERICVRYMDNPTNNSDGARGKHSPADQRNLVYWAYFFGNCSSHLKISSFNFNRQISELRPLVVPLSSIQLASFVREIDFFRIFDLRSNRPEQFRLLESWLLMRVIGFARDETFKKEQEGHWINFLKRDKISRIGEMQTFGLGLVRSIVKCSHTDRIHLHVITPLPLSLVSRTNTLIIENQQKLPLNMISSDLMSMKAESPGFSTQIVGTDVIGASARKTRHNMRRK